MTKSSVNFLSGFSKFETSVVAAIELTGGGLFSGKRFCQFFQAKKLILETINKILTVSPTLNLFLLSCLELSPTRNTGCPQLSVD